MYTYTQDSRTTYFRRFSANGKTKNKIDAHIIPGNSDLSEASEWSWPPNKITRVVKLQSCKNLP